MRRLRHSIEFFRIYRRFAPFPLAQARTILFTFLEINSIYLEISEYIEVVNAKERAIAFKALGDPTRLRIFEFLRNCCCEVAMEGTGDVRPVSGPTVGDVCCSVTGVGKITSTMSFHLKELRAANLITMEKRGKYMICGINRESVRSLGGYLDGKEDSSEDC